MPQNSTVAACPNDDGGIHLTLQRGRSMINAHCFNQMKPKLAHPCRFVVHWTAQMLPGDSKLHF